MRTRTRIALPFALGALALAGLEAKGPPAPKTGVPRWDARGVGRPAWQGVACLDVNDDASRITLGTIAPAGDPNVLPLGAGLVVSGAPDGAGKDRPRLVRFCHLTISIAEVVMESPQRMWVLLLCYGADR